MTISFNQLGNHGHLGNQMFQYAAIKGIAVKHDRSFFIPPKEVFGKYYYTKLRSNIDACFNIDCDRGLSAFPTVSERQFSFDLELFENFPNDDVNILGFFQSDKWFSHIEEDIKSDFTFLPEYFDSASELKQQFGKKLIALHIRRTDYVTNSHHNCQTLEYYENCLMNLPQDIEVLIFSDDPEWCKKQSLFSSDRFLVSETNDPYVDLCLMTMCDYIIIASSTFSWWGAYLSKAEKVFAPKKWFGPDNSHLETVDIYCKDWKII